MKRSFLSLIAAGLVVGCAIGPSTRLDPAPMPAARSTTEPTTSQRFLDSLATVNLADRATAAPVTFDTTSTLRWLSILEDSTLVELVRTAVAQNRDLRAAAARVREYRALTAVARGDLFPRVDANATYSTNKIALGSFPPTAYDAVRATADLQWEVDFWGKLRRQAQAASFDQAAREGERQATLLTVVSDVITAYLELTELDRNLEVAERTLESRQATLNLARQRFQQGLISELDVRQFESEIAGPAARVAEFARLRAQKENQLAVLIGQTPGPIPRSSTLATAVRNVVVPDSVSGALIARRPDVIVAERDWSAAAARVGVAIGNRLPKIAVTGSYGTQRPSTDGLFTPDGEIYSAQVGISVPLFAGGKLAGQQRAASARAEQARFRYEQTVLTALREAGDALVGARLWRDQLAAQRSQAEALRRAVALAEQRYQAGISSYLEVLDAQRGLFAAELALTQVERQYLAATVQLFKALGGAWE